jgi:hypothetical protein
VPAGPIYSVADQMTDPHFRARGLFEDVTLPDGEQVTVTTFAPYTSGIDALQSVVPLATPLPPRSLDHLTCVTLMLSLAVPPIEILQDVVE